MSPVFKWASLVAVVAAGLGAVYYKQQNPPMSADEAEFMKNREIAKEAMIAYAESHPLPVPRTAEEWPVPVHIEDHMRDAFNASLGWLFANPVPQDTNSGILEIGEEIVLVFQLWRKSVGPARARMRERIVEMCRYLLLNNKLIGGGVKAIGDTFTFAAMLMIMHEIKFDMKEWNYRAVATKDLLVNPATYKPDCPCQTMIFCALDHLGMMKHKAMEMKWRTGPIFVETQNHTLEEKIDKAPLADADPADHADIINMMYTITHEIMPYTVLGLKPVPFLTKEEHARVVNTLVKATDWLLPPGENTDIMSELLFCLNDMGVRDFPQHKAVIDRAYGYLLQQQADSVEITGPGTFGNDARMLSMGRLTSLVRHPVYTGLWAMVSDARTPDHSA